LGQARRIPGVTPAAVAVLDVYLTIQGARESSVAGGGVGPTTLA
jgi:hypothetical protein